MGRPMSPSPMNPIVSMARSIFARPANSQFPKFQLPKVAEREVFLSVGSWGVGSVQMHIVLVQVRVQPELLDEFEQALLHNARESVAHDPGCLRFDVSQHDDAPTRWG